MGALAAAASLAASAAVAEPGSFVKGRRGCVLLADLRTGGRYAESNGEAGGRAFEPGSVFKVASALALVRQGEPGVSVCPGAYVHRGRRTYCVIHRGHGPVDLRAALSQSCNYFFRERSGMSREGLLWSALELGLARPEALPALRTAPMDDLVVGLVPELSLSPEEMLQAASVWAARTDAPWLVVRRGLVECVRSGTCAGARVEGVSVAGKTGSPLAADGSGRTQAWFVGFAPAESPRAAVVVFLEKGRGREAAEIAGEVLRWYFRRSPS